MSSPEFDGRGRPSISDRLVPKGRLAQWLLVISIFCVVGLGAYWLTHNLRRMSAGSTPQKADPSARTNPAVDAWNPQDFHLPQLGLPAPPKPAPAPPQAAPVPVVREAPEKPKAKAGDQMMLTGGAQQNGGGARNDSGGTAGDLVGARAADSGQDSGPMKEMLEGSSTSMAHARLMGNRNFILAKGTNFDCVLNTKLVSTVTGMVSCTVPRNVYSDNGKVVLVERGSTIMGEYRANLQAGRGRIFVLWDRLKTVQGVLVDLRSPATDSLGEGGVGGTVDNHWPERISAALLLSLVEDAFTYYTTKEAASASGSGSVVVLPATTQQSEQLSSKILDSTINIPPTLTRDQGGKVNIFVARDLDFSGVYELHAE